MKTYIDVTDGAANALLTELQARVGDVEPYTRALGEEIQERTKERFATSTAPDGKAWAPNSPVTIARYIRERGGKAPTAKQAKTLAAGKKPLINHGTLSQQIHYSADSTSVTISAPGAHVFMMQFGGKKADYPHLFGDIPARAFFPVKADGSLYESEEEKIVESLQYYLTVG